MTVNHWTPSPSNKESTLTEHEFLQAFQQLGARGLPVTRALIFIFILFYIASLLISAAFTGFNASPNTAGLMVLGAMNPEAVDVKHEWFRLLMATLLHGGILHILMNSYALYIVGRFLEPLLGPFWYFSLFAIGGLGGSMLGLYVNAPAVISVGASGAIMGLFAMLGVCSLRVPPGKLRTALRIDAVQVLIPSLLPLGISIGGAKIDYAAHLGGAIAGVLGGSICLFFWKKNTVRPSRGNFAKGLFVVSVIAYLGSMIDAVEPGQKLYQRFKNSVGLEKMVMPNKEYEALGSSKADTTEALEKYPRDPRLLWRLAIHQADEEKLADAETTLKRALAEKEILTEMFPDPRFAKGLDITLGEVLYAAGKKEEARPHVIPYCESDMIQRADPKMRAFYCLPAKKK